MSAPAITPEALEAYLDASAAALALPIAPEHRSGVLRYLALAAGFAAQVEAQPLTPHDEPAVNYLPPA